MWKIESASSFENEKFPFGVDCRKIEGKSSEGSENQQMRGGNLYFAADAKVFHVWWKQKKLLWFVKVEEKCNFRTKLLLFLV